MILVSHPTGNAFSRALLAALLEAGLLGQFVTSLAVRDSDRFLRWLPGSLRREALRRRFDLPPSLLATHPAREICRLVAGKIGARSLTRQETGWCSWEAVYRAVDRAAARSLPGVANQRQLTGVYAYEDAALETFRAAKRLGLRCFYDLPIAYWETSRRLMAEELERLPEWAPTLEALHDSEAKARRKTEELALADTVICPSRFVHDTLPPAVRESRSKPCLISPFGSPPARPRENRKPRAPGAPLRVLFAGSMSQRKGLADLFSAMRLLRRPDIQLVVFGSPLAPMAFYRKAFPDFVYEPPRPHEEVLRLMETCDLLALPSIVEGRALVQQEALSCGLPLLVTPNAGGADLVEAGEEGRTGFLVPIRSPEALAEKLHWFADCPEGLEAMREPARAMAARLTWAGYAQKIVAALGDNHGGFHSGIPTAPQAC